MPSSATITSFFSFTAATVIRSSQVNTNFSNFRGHLIPVDPTAASSPDLTYDLGSHGHHWRGIYGGYNVFSGYATSTSVATPTTGSISVFAKDDGRLYSINSSGTVSDLFQYATATLPGLVSTATSQIFGGEKKFADGIAGFIETTTETGTAATLSLPKFMKRLSSAITSIAQITAPSTEKLIVLTNVSGADTTVLNSATATSSAIITGTNADLTFSDGASLWLYYDTTSSRWRIVGGSGSGGGGSSEDDDLVLAASGDTIAVTTGVLDQTVRVQGDTATAVLSTTPFSGTPTNLTVMTIVGNSDDYPVTFTYADVTNGCVGNFSEITLFKYQVAKFKKLESISRWLYVP